MKYCRAFTFGDLLRNHSADDEALEKLLLDSLGLHRIRSSFLRKVFTVIYRIRFCNFQLYLDCRCEVM